MKRNYLTFGIICSLFFTVTLLGCGQGGSETAATTTTTVPSGTVSISGQIAVASTDLVAAGLSSFTVVKPKFRTLATTGASGMTVSVIKVNANGTETDTGKTATSDSNGNYTVSGLSPLTEGYYRLEAEKVVGGNTLKVESISVPTSSGSVTENIAPETQIAVRMVEDSLKDNVGNSIKIEQETVKELKHLTVDDTEKMVDQGKINLPSNLTNKASQFDFVAAGIAENKGNSQKAFDKLLIENVANNAVTGSNLNKAMKAINEMVASGSGSNYLPPMQANRAYGQALLNGETKTVNEVIQAVDDALTGVALNSGTVATAFETQLNNIQTNYEKLVTGDATATNITQPEFLAFNETERKEVLTTSTTLDVIEQIALKNFIKQNYASNSTIDEIKLADNLGYLNSGLGINTTDPIFENIELYYGSYGGWKIVGSAKIRLPGTGTVNSVVLTEGGVTVGTMTREGDANSKNFRFMADSIYMGPTITTLPSTHTYQLVASLSTGSTITSAPVTLEVINIPEPSILRPDGTIINDASSGLGQGVNIPYYTIPAVTNKNQVFAWSTAEVASISLPTGYSWAYFVGVSHFPATMGSTTLEVNIQANQVNDYQSGSDLGSLFTNSAFLCPVTLTEEASGSKIAYKIYVQRVLLNSTGNFNGIAAGANRYVRYQP